MNTLALSLTAKMANIGHILASEMDNLDSNRTGLFSDSAMSKLKEIHFEQAEKDRFCYPCNNALDIINHYYTTWPHYAGKYADILTCTHPEKRLHLLTHLLINVELTSIRMNKTEVWFESVDMDELLEAATLLLMQLTFNHHGNGEFSSEILVQYDLSSLLFSKLRKHSMDVEQEHFKQVLSACFLTWDKFSGDYDYPVPSPVKGETAVQAYKANKANQYISAYGDLNIDLLQHIINQLRSPEELVLAVEKNLDNFLEQDISQTLNLANWYGSIDMPTLLARAIHFQRVLKGEAPWRHTDFEDYNGLCDNLQVVFISLDDDHLNGRVRKDMADILRTCFITWKNWTGDISYPVPVAKGLDGGHFFEDGEGLYEEDQLDYRKSLLNHIIEQLQAPDVLLPRVIKLSGIYHREAKEYWEKNPKGTTQAMYLYFDHLNQVCADFKW